jgi:drug/metabolite transporter (DMT)-like permease
MKRYSYYLGMIVIAIGVGMLAVRHQHYWVEYLSVPLIVIGTILVAKSNMNR